jgi:hypothetical protein
MRNTFVHDFAKRPEWSLTTDQGRQAATEFLLELTILSLGITGVFTSIFRISARERFGEELGQGHKLLDQLESHFGATAKKILAGRRQKPLTSQTILKR